MASRYSDFSQTASGQNHSAKDMVAAHRTLSFGTRVKVQSLATGKTVTVTIVDRGPFVKTRVIDLSSGAAKILGLVDLERVRLTVVPNR
jgi:rare lipoprotein A